MFSLDYFESAIRSVELSISEHLRSDVSLVEDVARYLVDSGGKRIRPRVMIASFAAVESSLGRDVRSNECPQELYDLGAMVEFIHSATLLHDDVVDGSEMRRQRSSANVMFGNAAAVLVGDFIYTRAFELMVKSGRLDILELMASVTNLIAEGEVMQLMQLGCVVDVTSYLRVVELKTGKLFEAAAVIGAMLSTNDVAMISRMSNFGKYLGVAFQIYDDILDYSGNLSEIGKNLGDDLKEGKITLPLINALRSDAISTEERRFLEAVIRDRVDFNFLDVVEILRRSGAIESSLVLAKEYSLKASEALDELSDSFYKKYLLNLSSEVVSRRG